MNSTRPSSPSALALSRRRADLLAGDVIGLDRDAVMPRHVKRQRPPAASRLDHRRSRLEPELAADQFHLGGLRFFQRNLGRRKVGARVNHLPIEPEAIEVVADVVVMIDVRSRAAQRVGPRPAPPLGQGCRQAAARLRVFGTVDDFEELQEIALDLDAAVAEGVAKIQVDIGQKLPERAAVVDFHPGLGSGVADRFTVPKHQGDRRVADGAQQAANQPALHGPHPAAFPTGSRLNQSSRRPAGPFRRQGRPRRNR